LRAAPRLPQTDFGGQPDAAQPQHTDRVVDFIDDL
jgi:hypothetical protein